MYKSIFILVLIITCQSGYGQVIQWQSNKDILDIGTQVTVLEDPERKFSINEVSSIPFQSKFKTSGTANPE